MHKAGKILIRRKPGVARGIELPLERY